MAIGCIAAAVLLGLGLYALVNYAIQSRQCAMEKDARQQVRDQIAEFMRGGQHAISLSNEGGNAELAAFLELRPELDVAKHYELHITYSHGLDEFLEQMAGAKGLRRLVIYKTDVSDAGIEYIATMPDLESVQIGRNLKTAVTDGKLAELRARLPDCTIEIGDDH